MFSGMKSRSDYPAMRQELSEKRKYRRFQLRQPAFAFFTTGPAKLREILDISMGGLSFSLIEDQSESLHAAATVSIMLRADDTGSRVENLPCRLVSEQTSSGFPPSPITRKRLGLQFTRLTSVQKENLRAFIRDLGMPE